MEKITPKKSLGQNFLIDKNISNKIISSLELSENDTVLEIGPGTGALTSLLLDEKINLTAVEIDKRAVEVLTNQFPSEIFPNLKIINQDIRDYNFEGGESKIKVIGNIPYYISADILFFLFENSLNISRAVIMVQKEVAQRVCGKSGTKDYGILTIAAAFSSIARIAFDVSPNCFFPKPKVTSSILTFDFVNTLPANVKFKSIMKFVKAAFSQRRKTLKNSLKSYLDSIEESRRNEFIINNEDILKLRAEALSPKDFIELFLKLKPEQENI